MTFIKNTVMSFIIIITIMMIILTCGIILSPFTPPHCRSLTALQYIPAISLGVFPRHWVDRYHGNRHFSGCENGVEDNAVGRNTTNEKYFMSRIEVSERLI